MAETLLSMSQKVAQLAGYSGNILAVNAATGDAARIVNFVREAAQYVQGLWGDWRFLWGNLQDGTTSTTSNIIPVPSDHYRWDQDRLFFDDHLVTPLMWHEFQMYANMNVPGYPTQFVIMPDSTIRMFPPPDSSYNYSFSWYREAPVLVNDNDEPLVPNRWRFAIINYALWLYAMYDTSEELAALARAEYDSWILLLEADQRPDGYAGNQSSGNHVTITPE